MMKKNLIKLASITAAVCLLNACTPYANLNINAPFKVGPVYVNPSIGIGGTL